MMKTYPESDLFLLHSKSRIWRLRTHSLVNGELNTRRETAVPPGQFIALQDFNAFKEAISGHGTFQIAFILTADSRSLYS